MSKYIQTFISHIIKGIVIAFLYFEITKENDTTFQNMSLFTFFYIIMIYGAIITGIEPNVVTSAFLTKTIFTLIDTRIKNNISNNPHVDVNDDTKYVVSEIIEDQLSD
jgi:hypothetical protein